MSALRTTAGVLLAALATWPMAVGCSGAAPSDVFAEEPTRPVPTDGEDGNGRTDLVDGLELGNADGGGGGEGDPGGGHAGDGRGAAHESGTPGGGLAGGGTDSDGGGNAGGAGNTGSGGGGNPGAGGAGGGGGSPGSPGGGRADGGARDGGRPVDAGRDGAACDVDRDGYLAAACGGNDCCDQDERAHPGASSWQVKPNRCGTFDYDCNGAAQVRWQAVSCHWQNGACVGAGISAATACGRDSPWQDCVVSANRQCVPKEPDRNRPPVVQACR